MLRSWLLGLAALAAVGAASAGWTAWMRPPPDPSIPFEQIACPPTEGPFLIAIPLGEPPYPDGAEVQVELRVFNPTGEPARAWGGRVELRDHEIRPDGRVVPAPTALTVSRDLEEGYEGIEAPPGGEATLLRQAWTARGAGEHVLLVKVDGDAWCAMAWYSVA